MVFLRVNTDHHGVASSGAHPERAQQPEPLRLRGRLARRGLPARAWLREKGVTIHFEGRRRAGCQIAIEFQDPDGNNLEIYWNIDQVAPRRVRSASEWLAAKSLEEAVANPVKGQTLPRRD